MSGGQILIIIVVLVLSVRLARFVLACFGGFSLAFLVHFAPFVDLFADDLFVDLPDEVCV